MTYRLRVINHTLRPLGSTHPRTIWENYIDAQAKESALPMVNAGFANLHKFKAVDVKNEPFLDFATEEDAMIFKLKFS